MPVDYSFWFPLRARGYIRHVSSPRGGLRCASVYTSLLPKPWGLGQTKKSLTPRKAICCIIVLLMYSSCDQTVATAASTLVSVAAARLPVAVTGDLPPLIENWDPLEVSAFFRRRRCLSACSHWEQLAMRAWSRPAQHVKISFSDTAPCKQSWFDLI